MDNKAPDSENENPVPPPGESVVPPPGDTTPPPTGENLVPLPEPASPPLPTLGESLRKTLGYSDQLTIQQQINRRTFVSFSAFFLLGAAAWKSWFLLKGATQSDGISGPLRKGLNVDDKIFQHTLSSDHLAKTYPKSAAAQNVRYNANIGLSPKDFDLEKWALQVTTADNRILSIGIDELRQLPKTEMVFEFKCIEGWSQISWWGGVKFSDFIRHYGLNKEAAMNYVGLTTPDDHYYVGIDTPSALHPQTLLAYEMTGQPLPMRHGAPLRLIIPVKYGVKNLKRVGKIFFSNDRPRDYWFERGYDYYCGL
jgi:DMSO/TMAO reductase YedYZ molybdopterin-dependent catalytic subunit